MDLQSRHLLFRRVFPICIALAPIGLLFGILAGQQGFNFISVLLLSIFGFSGSGQFTFLGFYQDGFENIGFLTAFIIILSMNIRYIPMTLVSIPKDIKFKNLPVYSHLLSDESFAVEKIDDDLEKHFLIRLYVFFTWVLSTLIGQQISLSMPEKIVNLLNISFPIAATLCTLSLLNIKASVESRNKLFKIILLFLINVLLFKFIGAHLFWIPAIFLNYFILKGRG